MAIRKKCILKFNLDNYYLHLADGLFALGKQAVNEAVRRYDSQIMRRPGFVTHQLRNSIGMAVYIDGRFDERLCYRPKPHPGKAKKWHGKRLRGNIEALRLLRSIKPSGKVAMVLVAAMPYRQFLEGAERVYKKDRGQMKRGIRKTSLKNAVRISKKGLSLMRSSASVNQSLKGLKSIKKTYNRNPQGASAVDRTGLGGFIVISDMYNYLKTKGAHLTGKVEKIVGGSVKIDSHTGTNKGKIIVEYGKV